MAEFDPLKDNEDAANGAKNACGDISGSVKIYKIYTRAMLLHFHEFLRRFVIIKSRLRGISTILIQKLVPMA